MADTQNSEPAQTTPHKTETIIEPTTASQNVSFQRSHLVVACSLVVGVSFFLPWINVLWAHPSGYDFAKEDGKGVLLWAVPFFAVFSCVGGLTKSYQTTGLVCAIVPFLILAYAWTQQHDIIQGLAAGAWIGLIAAAVLGVAARK